jgi:hypothetical protein
MLQLTGLAALTAALPTAARAAGDLAVSTEDGVLTVSIDERPVLVYTTEDKKIPRPYFHSLKAADGTQVSRNHPPQSGDLSDHDLFHPGLWMAFGDISGHDTWRLQDAVIHRRFTDPEFSSITRAGVMTAKYSIKVHNRYAAKGKDDYARETFRLTIAPRQGGWLLTVDSTFTALDHELTFGDQEEMGLGVRLATPLIVNNGGTILNNHGQENEKGCWGKAAAWCDYSGVINKKRYGILMLPHPENFKPSSFHVRDYGLMVANPFAEQAFGRGKPAKTIVKPGESLRVRCGVLVYGLADEKRIDAEAELANYRKKRWCSRSACIATGSVSEDEVPWRLVLAHASGSDKFTAPPLAAKRDSARATFQQ